MIIATLLADPATVVTEVAINVWLPEVRVKVKDGFDGAVLLDG